MARPPGSNEFSQTAELGIWVRRSGAWTRVTTQQVSAYQSPAPVGVQTVGWGFSGSFQLGTGIEAFGVTVESTDGTSATIDDIVHIKWTAQGAGSGTRTALPNGSTTTVTVRPK